MLKLLALLLTGAKFGKLLTSGGSMLLSLGVYALLYGWRYAAGFIALLFVHEAGHYIAARKRGLDVGLPTFIPFVGAWVQLKDLPHDGETEAFIGLAGPLLGSVGALACFVLARSWQADWLFAAAYAGFMLNLLNLLPLPILDGGRVLGVLWRSIRPRAADSPEAQTYYAVPTAKKWEYGLTYLLLAAFLALMSHDTHELLSSLHHRGRVG